LPDGPSTSPAELLNGLVKCFSATSGSDSEWAGVAGTVTNTLLAKMKEQSAALTKTMQDASSKKIDSVTHNLMCVAYLFS
jgi:hypothetical protein